MTNLDPFTHFDGAYVLGALDANERAAFEAHLPTCPACQARVREVQDVPALLAGLPAEAFDVLGGPADQDVPDTLLPALLRRVRAERRRRRTVTTVLAGLAAACLVAVVVLAWPNSSHSNSSKPMAMTALVASPVTATAALTDRAWGTEIALKCDYAGTVPPPSGYGYQLIVVDKNGHPQELGTWALIPGRTIRYTTGTALSRSQIASISIMSPTHKAILQLTL